MVDHSMSDKCCDIHGKLEATIKAYEELLVELRTILAMIGSCVEAEEAPKPTRKG
jgi:hypothetical protein